MAPTSDGSKILSGRLDGVVHGPDDPGFSATSTPWNLDFQHRPAMVVEAGSVADVVAAIGYARAGGLKVAVQATGHGVTAPADGAVLIITRGLDRVCVDAEQRSASVGGGATWAPVLGAAQACGLAPLLGSSPHTGAVGYTLGGGFGWLGRRYGLAAEHVTSLRVVLADGSVVAASETSESELFWALRGAGSGSLGVVVEMEIGLVPVASVYAGNLFYPIEAVHEAFEFYRAWSEGITNDFTSSFDIFNFPPIDMFPETLRGRAFVIVRGCHCGDEAEAASLIDRWRRWRQPEIDTFGSMPFREMASISQDPVDPIPARSSARWLTGIDESVVDAMLEVVLGGESPSPILFAETRHGGGAISGSVADTSYVAPEAERLLQVVGVTPDPQARASAGSRIETLWKSLSHRVDSVYLNLTEGEERRAETRNAFDFASWRRLAEVKRRVDPENLFAHGLDLT